MLVSNCRSSCGNETPGDQSQAEWRIQNYWDGGWNVVLRFPTESVQHLISNYARHAAENDHCGYSQSTRTQFWNALSKVTDYDPKNIITDCNADCSSSTMSIIKAVGYALNNAALKSVNTELTTHDMWSALTAVGFNAITSINPNSLQPGDILLNVEQHACIVVSDSDFATSASTVTRSCGNGNKQDSSGSTTTRSDDFYLSGESAGIAAMQGILIYLGYNPGTYRDKRGVGSGVDGDAGEESSMTNNALKLAIASGKLTTEKAKSILELLK